MADISSNAPLWDPDAALINVGGDAGDLKELLSIWIDQATQLLSVMESAWKSADLDRLHLSAHTLKSSLQLFGMAESSDITARLEFAGRNHNLDDCSRLLPRLRESLGRLIPEITRFVGTP